MKLEATTGASHAADAAREFVIAVQKHLPRQAFEELSSLPSTCIVQWADKWWVNAPCILEAAQAWCDGGWSDDLSIDCYQGARIPLEWFEHLDQLNRLPIDVTWLQSGLQDIMSDGERRAEDRVLAAIGADPLRESEERFIERARDHFRARVRRAQRSGYEVVTPKQKLDEHLNWLIEFQLHGQTRSAIAKNGNVVRRAVERAIQDLAGVLGLTLRPADMDAG